MKIIISENQFSNLFIRRRMETFGKYVRSTYNWLDPKRFNGYDDFFTEVIFGSLSDFLSAEMDLDYDTLDKIRYESIPFITEFVEKELGDEIRKYFDKEVRK